MNISHTHKNLLTVALAVVFSIPAIGMATTMTQEKNLNPVTVSFADLNLSQDKGVETLYQRLKTGARQSCGTVSARQVSLFRANKDCIDTALTKAIESIDNEKLKRLHAS